LCPLVRVSTFLVFLWLVVSRVVLAQSPGGTIQGRALDPDDRPVVNAVVIVEGPTAAPRTVSSDATGHYAITGLTPGRYHVRASSPGLRSSPYTVDVGADREVALDLSLRLTAIDEALVVTASQVAGVRSRLPDSTTVITGADLQVRQQFSLTQALRTVPGLTLQQSGGPGTLTSLFTRGGESDFTLVLVDGIRANAFGGGIDLSQVPLADVDRIEVVRGPQSALYGADAIGGVVQILTRSGGTPSVDGTVEGGSRAMRRAAGSTAGEHRGFRWQAGGDYFAEDGYTGPASNGEPVTNDDARTSQGAVVLGWRHASSGGDVAGTVRYVDTDRGTPGAYGSDPAGRFGGVDRESRNLTARTSGGARWVQPWFGASSRVRQRTEVDFADFDLVARSAFPSEGETKRAHVRTQVDVAASAAVGVSGGIEWIGEEGKSTFITAGSSGAPAPIERSVLGLFGEARWTASERLSVTAGLRGERIHRQALEGDPFSFASRPDFPADTVVSLNPKVSASWMLAGDPSAANAAWTRLHGAAGTGIRPPDAFDIGFTNNPGLRPERSRSIDVGIAQAFASGRAEVDVTAFFNDYDDLIIAVGTAFTGLSAWSTDNIANARARGVELSGAWRPSVVLGVTTTYTFLSTEIREVDGSSTAPPPYSVGDRLPRRPRHQGTIDVNWSLNRAAAFLQLLMRGQTLDVEPAFGAFGGLYDNPGYAVVHLGASFRVARGVSVLGRVMNLFDTSYEEILGYFAPGRTAYLGVRLAAGR
jgi:outer membrane cobalamin receptor